jgi:hypothetical protein
MYNFHIVRHLVYPCPLLWGVWLLGRSIDKSGVGWVVNTDGPFRDCRKRRNAAIPTPKRQQKALWWTYGTWGPPFVARGKHCRPRLTGCLTAKSVALSGRPALMQLSGRGRCARRSMMSFYDNTVEKFARVWPREPQAPCPTVPHRCRHSRIARQRRGMR